MTRTIVLIVLMLGLSQVAIIAEEAATDPQPGSLMAEFIDAEINTLSPEELADWASSLGLDPGNDPKKAIQDFYKTLKSDSPLVVHQDPQQTQNGTDPQKVDQNIKVQKADQVEYFTIDEIDEKFMRLSGGVILELSDKKSGVVHNISADQIIISRKTDFVSARGNISYKKTTNGKTEVFTGDDLLFNSKNYESWIVNVDSSVSNDKERQRYKAQKAYKSTKSLSILRDVNITSSVWDPPAYRIHADKLFLLQTGEWYIEGAVLYVGEIPAFYFPFFFNPSDELVFHPSLGYHDYYGAYLQTTTYIIGQKKDKTALLDALKISIPQDDPNGNTNIELKGLFLRQVAEQAQAQKESKPEPVNLKLIADVYARFGAIISMRLEAEKLAFIKNTKVGLGIAYTKNIYIGTDYTIYKYDGSKITDKTSGSYLFGTEIPFRFFFDVQSSIEFANSKLNLSLPLYSDPTVWSDFSLRSENIEWFDMLNLKLDSDPNLKTPEVSKQRLDLSLILGSPIDIKLVPPWLESLTINKFELKLGLKSLTLAGADALDTSAFKTSNLTTYVIDTATAPSVGVSVKGKVSTQSTPSNKANKEGEKVKIIEPWTNDEPQAPESGESSQPKTDDSYLELLPGISQTSTVQAGDSSWTLTYSVNPSLDVLGYFPSNLGMTYDQIDNSAKYWAMVKNANANFESDVKVLGTFLELKNTLTYKIGQSDVLWQNEGLTAPVVRSVYLDLDKNFINQLEQTTEVTTYPLIQVAFLKQSTLSYTLTTNLYSNKYGGVDGAGDSVFVENLFDYQKDDFKSHIIKANLNFNVPQFTGRASYSYNIFPTTKGSDLTYSAEYTIPNLYMSISSGLKWNETDTLVPQDLQSTAKLTFDPAYPKLNLNEVMVYDFNYGEVKSFSSILNLDILTASLLFTKNNYISWEDSAGKFIADSTSQFQLDSYYVNFKPKLEIEPYWKNRVTLSVTPSLEYSQSVVDVRNSYLNAGLDLDFGIFELLTVKIGLKSQNRRMFRYFDSLAQRVGLSTVDIFDDLVGSYNFANTQERQKSSFKFQTINIETVHKMGDWDLTLSYVAEPKVDNTNLALGYKWQYTFGFDLSWKPIPLVKTKLTSNNDVLKVE